MLAMERGKKLNEVEDKTEQLSNDAKVIYPIVTFRPFSACIIMNVFAYLGT